MTEIVTLPQSEDCDLRRFAAVDLVLRHWERLRDGRPMPRRAEIDPQALAKSLEYMFIAEPVAPRVARLRLSGQHLSCLLGMEPRGMPLCALFAGRDRDELALAVEQVSRHNARVMLPLAAETGIGRPALKGMMALLPLADETGRASRILGVLQTRGAIGRSPRKLTLTGPAETLQVTPERPDPAMGRPQLRVITGGLGQP